MLTPSPPLPKLREVYEATNPDPPAHPQASRDFWHLKTAAFTAASLSLRETFIFKIRFIAVFRIIVNLFPHHRAQEHLPSWRGPPQLQKEREALPRRSSPQKCSASVIHHHHLTQKSARRLILSNNPMETKVIRPV